ncbi:fatty acid biosynthesis transcriptional regulator FabT [Streptococcus sp. DD12]|uniref:fatty acid biosynthesis transcriptional regulator FabT n=1 Tax=Streptococcus sp. DD12 TaxID=1777880 RepID=UPI0007927DB1|nr:MarR family transcriptional regulator [Streptococcus sp. DD12]KXT75533.1 Transcriptional regulator of fatty acid biosynthesis FabT [Streptococcus sp. DD12]
MEYHTINDYLTSIFNKVNAIEENSLRTSRFHDVSLKEMHTIDIIGSRQDCTPSDIARELMITLGTVTSSLNRLEKKGYITRQRSTKDRRVIHLYLTRPGRLLFRLHARFHKEMVKRFTDGLGDDELKVLETGLLNLHHFLEELK